MEPDHRGVVARVAEGLELFIPRRSQRDLELAPQLPRVAGRDLHRVADAVFADDDVARGVGLGIVDAETRRVQPATAFAAGRGILGHLEPEMLPPADRGGQRRSRACGALPVELRATAAA